MGGEITFAIISICISPDDPKTTGVSTTLKMNSSNLMI
jgi:hypothetical protein